MDATSRTTPGMGPKHHETHHRSHFPVMSDGHPSLQKEAGLSKHLSPSFPSRGSRAETVTGKSRQVPDRAAEFEPPDPRCGELPGVQVGDVLHGLLQLPDILSLQGQHRLAGVGFNLKPRRMERGEA